MMLKALSASWWVFLVRGIVAILFGITAVAWPGLTVSVLITLFGIYAIFDGVVAIYEGITQPDADGRRFYHIALGVAGILVGILAFLLPISTAVALLYLIAAWLVVSGVIMMVTAIRVRQEIQGEFFLILFGALAVLLGLFFFAFPGDGILSLIWMLGIQSILAGIFLIVFAFKVRSMGDQLPA